jgi:hypothetical protein
LAARSWDDDPARVAPQASLRDDGGVGVPRPSLSFVDNAVRVDVANDPLAQPRLRTGSARGGWIRLSLDGRTLAYARHEPYWQGLAWLRVADGHALGLLPPITSELARATPLARWTARFAQWLFATDERPLLSAGTYALAPIDTPNASGLRDVERPLGPPLRMLGPLSLHLQPCALRLSWSWRLSTQANVLVLREASSSSASRVKAWRKHARDGTLPPALLAWLSALDAYVVLDGHDRLHAAALEGAVPHAVSLHAVRAHGLGEEVRRAAEARYLRAFEREQALSPRTRRTLNEELVRSYAFTGSRAGAWVMDDVGAQPQWCPREMRAVDGRAS